MMEAINASGSRDVFLAIATRTNGFVFIARGESVFSVSLAIIYLSPRNFLGPVVHSGLNSLPLINYKNMTFQTVSVNHYYELNRG